MRRVTKKVAIGIKKKSSKKAKNKAINKFIISNIAPILIFVGILLLTAFLTGIILFFITMPGMMLGKIDDWGREILGNMQGIFTGDSTTANISAEEIVHLAEHLERMGYDVQAYGLGTVKYKDDGKTTSLRNGKAQEIEEITKNVEGKEYLRSYIAANENTYILSQYNILGAFTSEIDNIQDLLDFNKDNIIKDSKDYSTGLIDIEGSSSNLLRTSNSTFAEINRDTKQLKIYSEAINLGTELGNAEQIFTGNPDIKWGEAFSYDLNNWVGRYGRPTELSLALHLSTMMPDLPYEIATGKKFNTKVKLRLQNVDVNYEVSATKKSSTLTNEDIEKYYDKYCKNDTTGTIPGTKWEKEEIIELKKIADGGNSEPIDVEHAKKCGDFVWDGHNNRIWNEWHQGNAPGDINAYTQSINILWNKDYKTCEVYDVVVENNPEWKTETSLFFFNSQKSNEFFYVKVEKIDRTVEAIKNALEQGCVVPAISDANAFRDNNGNHKEWTGAHWGVIFLFDGTHFHMKGGGSGHISDGLYTPEQLKEWLVKKEIGNTWGQVFAISRGTTLKIKWPFIVGVEDHWFYEDIDFTKNVYRIAKAATKQIDYTPEDEENILNRNKVDVKLESTLNARQGVIYQVAEPETIGPNDNIEKIFNKKYYKYDGTIETSKKIENAKAIDEGKSTYRFNGEEVPADKTTAQEVKKVNVDFKDNVVESFAAFGILENMHTEASEYVYRNLKELMVDLKYFKSQEVTTELEQILVWPIKTDNQNRRWELVKGDDEFGTIIKCENDETDVVSPSEAKVEKINGNEITLEFDDMSDESLELLEYIYQNKNSFVKINRELVTKIRIKIKDIQINPKIKEGTKLSRREKIGKAIGNADGKKSITITMYNLDKSVVEDINNYFNQEDNTKYEELMNSKKIAESQYKNGIDISKFGARFDKNHAYKVFFGQSGSGYPWGTCGPTAMLMAIDVVTDSDYTTEEYYQARKDAGYWNGPPPMFWLGNDADPKLNSFHESKYGVTTVKINRTIEDIRNVLDAGGVVFLSSENTTQSGEHLNPWTLPDGVSREGYQHEGAHCCIFWEHHFENGEEFFLMKHSGVNNGKYSIQRMQDFLDSCGGSYGNAMSWSGYPMREAVYGVFSVNNPEVDSFK